MEIFPGRVLSSIDFSPPLFDHKRALVVIDGQRARHLDGDDDSKNGGRRRSTLAAGQWGAAGLDFSGTQSQRVSAHQTLFAHLAR